MATSSDILVLGATGYTGRLMTRYLSNHPQRTSFTLAIGARSPAKLEKLVAELDFKDTVTIVDVDVSSKPSLDAAIQRTRIVINAVGPYWTWGTSVVESCVQHHKHYVDISGEVAWIQAIIERFHEAAATAGTMIVPAVGWDSLPSDILVYLANKTLKRVNGPTADMSKSTTAWLAKSGGPSGGSINTIITTIEDVPMDKLVASSADYALSPIKGVPSARPQFYYTLPFSGNPPVVGCFWIMEGTNKAIVQRSWGLNQLSRRQGKKETELATYGPQFQYSEFLVMSSKVKAVSVTVLMVLIWINLVFIPPIRWLFKRMATQPGNGASDEELLKGSVVGTNITTSVGSTSTPPTHIRTVVTGLGDPAYLLTAIMACESALALLLDYESLPAFAREGGVLTPITAMGDTIISRLEQTEKVKFESEVIEEATARSYGKKM